MSLLVQVTFLPSFFLLNAHDCVGGLRNATVCCGCIYVASVNSGALGPFTPVDPLARDLSGAILLARNVCVRVYFSS